MELREMIDKATEKVGNQNTLAKVLGLNPGVLTEAKAGRRGLPSVACGKLGDIIDVDRWTVVAASELITERNPDKRAYLTPFVHRHAAAWMLTVASSAFFGIGTPGSAHANDTLNVSAKAGNALPVSNGNMPNTYYVNSQIKRAIQREVLAPTD